MTTTNPIHVISPKPSVGHDVTYVDSFWFKYILSSLSASVAETVTYPLDLTKTRLQIQGERAKIAESGLKHTPYRGMVATMLGIIREEGFTNLWKGLSPAIYRHLVYSGIRMATYEYMRDNVLQKKSDGSFPLWKSALGGMTAGAVGQFCANPTDLIKVQMQMEGRRRLEGKPPRVKGVIEAASQILREGGVRGLWKGWAPNVQRGALVNLGDLTTYDTAKHFFLSHTSLKDGHLVHIMSSVCAGFVGATMATPADVIKSRIMNQPTDSKGRGLTYKSSIECLMATIRNEGAFALYKGFIPTWIRMAPWSLTFWEEPLRGRGLLGEPEQQFLRPQPNMVHQMESEAKLALANTLINALVQSQQQPVLPTPAPLMAQPLMNASLFGGGVRGRRDEPRYRRDEARGSGQKMTRKEFGDRRRDEKPYDRKKNIQAKQTPSRGKAGDKENGKKDKTPSKGARQGKDEEDNTPYKGLPKRYFFCHLCYKEVWNGPSFERHLKGAMHNDVLKRTEEVHNARIESLRLLSQLQEEKREKNNDRRYVPGAMQHCNMCDADFSGSLFRHRKSKTHLSLKAFIHPKCYMCNEDFHSRIDRDEHFLTAKHLKKLYEFEGDDLVPKTPQEAEKAEVEVVEVEEYDPANPTEEDESKGDQAKAKDDKILPKLAPKGRTIYHCNVCNLYFSHVEMVYDRHCRTEGHHDHYGYAIAVRNDIKVEEEEEGEKEDQEEEKTAEKKDGDDDGSDDDGNWKRRGTKKRDETDNDEYNSQEARSEEKEEVESNRKRDRTDSEKEEEGINPKIQKVEMKEDIPGAETTSIKKEEMDSSQNKGADSGKVEEGLNQEVKAKEEIPVVEVTKKEKSNVVKTGNEETASDSGTPIAETESETSQPKVEEKTSDESKEEKTSKPTAAKPKPGPKTAKNLPAAKGPVKTPAKVAPSLGTKKPGPASKTVQPQAKKAAVVNKPAPASVKGVKKGATATPQAANGAAKGKGAAS